MPLRRLVWNAIGHELRSNALIDQVMYDQFPDTILPRSISMPAMNWVSDMLYARMQCGSGRNGMNFPFDANHIYIHKYQHLGVAG
jgi:hypothetical protein